MSESQRASAPDPFEIFLVASGKLAEMGGSATASESQAKVTEVPRSGKVAAGKRKAGRSPYGPMESRRVKVSPSSGGELGSSQSSSWVDKMKSKLLSWDMEAIAEGSAELAADEVCRSLLKDEDVKSLKRKNELLQAEYDFFLGGSAVITRWETVREYLAGQHLSWDLEGLDHRYAQVVKAHAQFKGLPAPEMVESLMALNDAPPS
ncbi:unnamed protein product [Cochlearia groenlandica]